jgi:hypothetical protein
LAASLIVGWVGVRVLPAQRVFAATDLDSAMKAHTCSDIVYDSESIEVYCIR